jgi:hypothetical protein
VDPSLPFVVGADASDFGMGAVLSQYSAKDQKLQPRAFSRLFTPAARNYDVGNRELVVKLDLEEWLHWLAGSEHPFTVWTDHKNLAYIQEAKLLQSATGSLGSFLHSVQIHSILPPRF